MKIQEIDDSIWRDVLLSNKDYNLNFLAVQILLSRLKSKVQTNSSPEKIAEYVNEMKFFFSRYENLPPVQADLKQLIGEKE
ncbi:MAG TPA: hypothetical protein VEC37_02815 [Bacillota bacterium]|nr:hypothetical protein [Bacillota bacterium]